MGSSGYGRFWGAALCAIGCALSCGGKFDPGNGASEGIGGTVTAGRSGGAGGTPSPGRSGGDEARGATGGVAVPPKESVCKSPCVRVYGIQHDSERACFDESRSVALGCDCRPLYAGPRCVRRNSDGTLWFVQVGTFSEPEAWGECPAELDGPGGFHSCAFSHCETPPRSTCGYTATCRASQRCNTVQYDGSGCSMPACTNDADCRDTDRCITVECIDTFACYQANDQCICEGTSSCTPGKVCNVTATYGERGEWLELSVTEKGYHGDNCPSRSLCNARWALSSDGTMTMTRTGEKTHAKVDAERLQRVIDLIEGPSLRPKLRDGPDCGEPTTRGTISIELRTSTADLVQDVTECVSVRGSDFRDLYDLVAHL